MEVHRNGLDFRNAYNIESDDEDENDDETEDLNEPNVISTGIDASKHVEDMLKLKEQTDVLLDTKFRQDRNKLLLRKMLELEDPTVTVKMVEFLLQESVCEELMNFIINCDANTYKKIKSSHDLDESNDTIQQEMINENNKNSKNEEEKDSYHSLKLSYRATMILTPEESSEAMSAFLSKRAVNVTKCLFEVFTDDFKGSFHHPHRILEYLLKSYPCDVYDAIESDSRLEVRMRNICRYIGYPPVADMIVMLVGLTPLSRYSPLFSSSARYRWNYFIGLSNWIFLKKLVEIIVHPSELCYVEGGVTAITHATAAAQVLLELVDRLSGEDIGEILLQPLGHISSLIDSLVICAAGGSTPAEITSNLSSSQSLQSTSNSNTAIEKCGSGEDTAPLRAIVLRFLCFLLRRSMDEESPNATGTGSSGVCSSQITPGAVAASPPNRLNPLRQFILHHIHLQSQSLLYSLQLSASTNNTTSTTLTITEMASEGLESTGTTMNLSNSETASLQVPVKHPGHVVKYPFTLVRLLHVELLVLLVEAEEGDKIASSITAELWGTLMTWIRSYPHNNLYHTLFYRLLFAVVRREQEEPLRILSSKPNSLTFSLKTFIPLLTFVTAEDRI